MAEVEEEVVFYTKADQVQFRTQTNGDNIYIKNLRLTQGQATSITWLVNADGNAELEFSIKVKGT
ncbi:hypothetical protein LCGC14_1643750 [marine sediment metagenome]|uniref:Uncharacterized protein n=1 Tax=marine sediment metagenome TaxID=412755 RepID=A0A0F9KYQ9_9ZZZZ